MSDFNRGFIRPVAGTADMAVDAGLRAFMLGVYNKLALGLVLSGVLAYLTSHQPFVSSLYVLTPDGRLAGFTGLGLAVRFAPLIAILIGLFAMRSPTARSSGLFYWLIVSLIGAGSGLWFLLYTSESIAEAFFVTAGAFAGLSLFGYTTKRDLTGVGSFLIMGLWGIILAGLANIFLHSPGINFVVSVLGVFIFAGLIAFDTQRLKLSYYDLGGNTEAMGVLTNYGALNLYLNFVNLFQLLLSLFGNRR